ncbi:alpha/beta hydrolase [Umezawaea endophytica]|uniref:Alpha/beta hydrolase n=1 Tax=Umezawaea endophytica TaxID=1654476 RepID=A0A9X2VIW0_9PSEU|nr:alpha/beta hydrolase [Umezawaea endophytica]MCS7477371.1 alpha/beta hydrolase [Umezawaea endophytica]
MSHLRWAVPAACLGVPAWLLATRWSTITHAHPAYLVVLVLVGCGGLAAAVRPPRPRWFVLLPVALLLAPLVWLRPFAATSGVARTVDHATTVELVPTTPVRNGLVFYPGARVDPRAYLRLLDAVAARGTLVVVVKAPFDFALLTTGAAADVLDAHPEVHDWTVGGHSLGGVAASRFAATGDPRVRGLLLWASYPVDDLSHRTDLAVWSLSGERDGFTTPSDVADSRRLLPPDTRYVQVPGAVHAFFGDYGDQSGDGVPTTSRETAQERIVEASVEALNPGLPIRG